MKSLLPIWTLWSLTYYRAALRSLQHKNPCHQDIPRIVLTIHQLESQQ
jgi:hypothetical protein